MMLSTANLLSPADGGPVVAPTQDMVLGCYYLTMEREATRHEAADPLRRRGRGDPRLRARARSRREASTRATSTGRSARGLHSADRGRRHAGTRSRRSSSRGPDDRRPGHLQPDPARPAALQQQDHEAGRRCASLVDDCYRLLGPAETAHLVDGIKSVGFEFATRGGMTIAVCRHRRSRATRPCSSRRPTTRSPRSTSSSSAASSPRTSATSRSSSLEGHDTAMSDAMMDGAPTTTGPVDDDDRLRARGTRATSASWAACAA